MMTFDHDRYLKIQSGAVALADSIHAIIGGCVARGAQNIFFLGTGGAAILMHPAVQLLQRAGTMPAYAEISAEIVTGGHAQLGARSIVVIPSLSGTTRESVELVAACKARGCTVLALVGHAGTPVAADADHPLVNFAEDDTSCESFYMQGLLVALSLLHHRGEIANYASTLAQLRTLPPLLAGVKNQFVATAETYAAKIEHETYHLITAAGNCWPQAWYFGMCILEEMQWIRTRPVHAADFFHGPLELIEKGVSVIICKGEDACRPLTERVERFVNQYTDKVFALDTASFKMPGISPAVRALVSPLVLASALERLSAHLAAQRHHPLTTRRYYKRVPY